ncbi:methylthioribose-1-phosphate isomerase [Silvimonas terrae]|uniref:Methylthioribose-1-phosphate isomerase n=1 Tax=Silvimonas terrae TaxID=300266 RepID=A0A840RF39_9NEIS|nr:S-methyl-5-thioribose-1-phosphate isomerase [Silvimonas terrae]MBB5191184.1 methylthioribose-1-phosphate isomerase [Silvimonas terrae]
MIGSSRSIWREGKVVHVIDQTRLPHHTQVKQLTTLAEVAQAIQDMVVRGAPLIGVTAAYGVALALQAAADDASLATAVQTLIATRPTAVNLRWAVEHVAAQLATVAPAARAEHALLLADELAQADVHTNEAIGEHGAALLQQRWQALGYPARLNVLTHCNAGRLGCVDWGTALAAIYKAHAAGVPVHVWMDETRPRNQGASLTTWELAGRGVPATLIVDNAGGLLMQQGQVDVCIVGADRISARGDVCNKIGTYLKALAAQAHAIPFYVAAPLSTLDWGIVDGVHEIEIEQRSPREVTHISGRNEAGEVVTVQLAPDGTAALNPAFDVTPAVLVTAIVTERGVVPASHAGLASLREPALA